MPDHTDHPTDLVRLVITDAAAGDYFRLGTRTTPDKLIFKRCTDRSNAHEHVMPLAEWQRIQGTMEDLGLHASTCHAFVEVHFIIDEAAHGGGEDIAALRAQIAELEQRHAAGIAALGKDLDEARAQKPAGEVRAALTAAEQEYLAERDTLIGLLLPHVVDQEKDTPVSVLERVLERVLVNQKANAAGDTGFDPDTFKASLPEDVVVLRALATPLGIDGAGKSGKHLRKLITEAEAAKRAAA